MPSSSRPPDPPTRGNLLDPPGVGGGAERIERLLERQGVRIDRIISTGQASPEGFWYDQERDEWVALLTGGATLELLDPDERIDMTPGDWLLIPAHRRHRVVATSPREPTIWLAVHLDGPA